MLTTPPPSDPVVASAVRSPLAPASDVGDPATRAPGASKSGVRKLARRERAGIILLLMCLGYLLVVVYDRWVGIPNR